MALFSLLPLLGFACWLQDRFRFAPATSLLFAVSGWIIVAFAGGLIGALWWTCMLIWVLGLTLFGHRLFAMLSGRVARDIPTSYGMLIVFGVLFWLVHGDSQFFYYDEYAHWGVFYRDMTALDAFWGADTNSMHPRYPPAAPLWQYAFGIFLAPGDSVAYLAQFILLFTPLMVLWHKLAWRQIGWIFGAGVLCLVVLLNFGHGVTSLYVDHVIGAWFVGIILCAVVDPPKSLPRALLFCLPLTVLALIKDVGLAFALAAAGIIALLTLRQRVACGSKWTSSLAASVLLGIVLVLPAVVSVQTWTWNRDSMSVPQDDQSLSGVSTGLIDGGNALDEEQRAEVAKRFKQVFFDQQLSKSPVSWQFNAFSYPIMPLFTDRFRLTTFWMFVAFVIWYAVMLRVITRGEARWTWGLVGLGLIGTAVAYTAGLYFGYQHAFGERGLILSSYIRYMHSMVLPLAIAAFAPFLPGFGPLRKSSGDGQANWYTSPASIFTIGLALMIVTETPYARPLLNPFPRPAIRVQTERAAELIRSEAEAESVWIFLPVDTPNGFDGRVLLFQLSPVPATLERSESFFAQSDDEMIQAWRGFGILWFPLQSDELVTRLSGMLGEEFRGEIIRVNEHSDGSVVLEQVPSS